MQSRIAISSRAMHVVYANLDGRSIKVIGSAQWFSGRVLSFLFSDLFIPIYAQLWSYLKTYAAISNAHLFRVCKRGKLSGSCLSTLNGFGSIQLPIFLCHIGVPTFSSQNN